MGVEHNVGDTEAEESIENVSLDWSEISEAGVDEETFLQNLDIEMLETVAAEFQALVDEPGYLFLLPTVTVYLKDQRDYRFAIFNRKRFFKETRDKRG